jgi:hypothetical protein
MDSDEDTKPQRDREELAKIVVNCGFQLHKELGPGLLESVYEAVLQKMLQNEGLSVQRQLPIPNKSLWPKLRRRIPRRPDRRRLPTHRTQIREPARPRPFQTSPNLPPPPQSPPRTPHQLRQPHLQRRHQKNPKRPPKSHQLPSRNKPAIRVTLRFFVPSCETPHPT